MVSSCGFRQCRQTNLVQTFAPCHVASPNTEDNETNSSRRLQQQSFGPYGFGGFSFYGHVNTNDVHVHSSGCGVLFGVVTVCGAGDLTRDWNGNARGYAQISISMNLVVVSVDGQVRVNYNNGQLVVDAVGSIYINLGLVGGRGSLRGHYDSYSGFSLTLETEYFTCPICSWQQYSNYHLLP